MSNQLVRPGSFAISTRVIRSGGYDADVFNKVYGLRGSLLRHVVQNLLEAMDGDSDQSEDSQAADPRGSPVRYRLAGPGLFEMLNKDFSDSERDTNTRTLLGDVVGGEGDGVNFVPESTFQQLLDRYREGVSPQGELGSMLRAVYSLLSTQFKIAETCVAIQSAFLRTNDASLLKPIQLKAVATTVGVSPSTVSATSRAVDIRYAFGVTSVRELMPSGAEVRRARIRKELHHLRSDPTFFHGGKWRLTDTALAEHIISRIQIEATVNIMRREVAKLKRG